MSYIKGINRNQSILFPEMVDDYIEDDNPIRFIDAFVDNLNLVEMGFKNAIENETGRPPYHPGDLLKLYIYGYIYSIRSSRKLEKETHRNIEVLWLLRKLRPDFKTLADFRKNNRKAIRKVCREFILLCKKWDLFGRELIAIDGSKFRAVNSINRNYTVNSTKKRITRIDKKIEEYLNQCDKEDENENSSKYIDKEQLEKRIQDLKERRNRYQEVLDELEKDNKKQISITDKDSRIMPTSKGMQVSYNVQIAVDDKNKLIVAEDVTNEPVDMNNLSGIAFSAKDNIGAEEITAVTDMGYYNGSEVKKCLEHGITPYIDKPNCSANVKLGLFSKDKFKYDKEKDCYICPAGKRLIYRFDRVESGRHIRYYVSYACKDCSLKVRCTRNKYCRRITRWIDEDILDEMQERIYKNPELIKRRKSIVEHPFGTMKRWKDQGYFLMKGLEKVKAEFSLSVLAYNMTRVINIIGVKQMINALA